VHLYSGSTCLRWNHCIPVLYIKKKPTQNGLLAHGVYGSERMGTYECCMHKLTFFTLTSACLADERAKVRRNRALWEWCMVDSSCSTYRVGKVQSIFSLPINKRLFRCSVIPLFHILRFTDSPCALQARYALHIPLSNVAMQNRYSIVYTPTECVLSWLCPKLTVFTLPRWQCSCIKLDIHVSMTEHSVYTPEGL